MDGKYTFTGVNSVFVVTKSNNWFDINLPNACFLDIHHTCSDK